LRRIFSWNVAAFAGVFALLIPGVAAASVQAAPNSPACWQSAAFCVWDSSGSNAYSVPTVDHSAWFSFSSVGVPYHPSYAANHSNSTIWLLDDAAEQWVCLAPGSPNVKVPIYQSGYFYVQYNVSNCPGNLPARSP
jgi:hypothetical protein